MKREKSALTVEQARERLKEIDREIDRLEGDKENIDFDIGCLEDERRTLEATVPPPPPLPPEVWRCEVADGIWFTDGYLALRGEWPGEHRVRGDRLDLAHHLPVWLVDAAPVEICEVINEGAKNEALLLGNGKAIARKLFDQASAPGRVLVCGPASSQPILFKDEAGEPVAAVMPLSIDESHIQSRRPFKPAPEAA